MNAEIITIGDELLIGQVVDTNSAFLAAELNKLGIPVIQITSVSDNREKILEALDSASGRADLIVCTGGLGPTSDDITKQTLAEYFKTRLIINPYVVDRIREFIENKGLVINERNLKQAELPDCCEVLPNSAGTAQGMWFTKDNKQYISLPGVPFELKAIWYQELEKRIKERYPLPQIMHFTILTHGIPESIMADRIHNWEINLPSNLKLAYLPSAGILRLRLTGKPENASEDIKSLIDEEVDKLRIIIGPHIFGYNDDRLEEIVGRLLKDTQATLSTAESCTGGLLSNLITSIPGSSEYFKGGVIAYSNEVKTSELSVSPYSLLMNGAVSQAVVEQMADGVRNRFNTDYAIAVSGIAGPEGGTIEKPVGTTWIGIATRKRLVSSIYKFGNERESNIRKAAVAALFMLRNEIIGCS